MIGLTLSVGRYGLLARVVMMALSDLCRYVLIFIGRVRGRFAFGAQDLIGTVVVFGLIWECCDGQWVMNFSRRLVGAFCRGDGHGPILTNRAALGHKYT